MGFSTNVGMRIKYYRKLNQISLQGLSMLVHKSVSTLSKYESGQIVIDVETLHEIASALSVSIYQLLEEPTEPILSQPDKLENHFFLKTSPLYAYYMAAHAVSLSVFVPVRREGGMLTCKVFMETDSAESYSTSRFFFHADIHCFDSGAAISIRNPFNASDHGFIYAKLPYSNTAPIIGLFTFSSEKIGVPACVKVLFSAGPITQKDYLLEKLSSNNKLTLNDLKKLNMFLPW